MRTLFFLLLTCCFCTSTTSAQVRWTPKKNTAAPQNSAVPAPVLAGSAPSTDGGKILMPAAQQAALIKQDPVWRKALEIHYNAIVTDGHVDVPTLMISDPNYKFAERHATPPHVDLPRMFEGGLDAPFFSIYVGAEYPEGLEAKNRAREEIYVLKSQLASITDKAELATTAAEVRRITKAGKKAILMGIEGGHAIANASPVLLRTFYDLGIRYITLTHVNTNSFADASQSPAKWGGLNEAGRNLVKEMNKLGVLVDISHVADSTFWDALAVSKAPMIASHSSARALTESPRNMTDEMLRALAAKGGVVHINYMTTVVNRALTPAVMEEVYRRLRDDHQNNYYKLWMVVQQVMIEKGIRPGTLDDVVAHIAYVARMLGVDHVGLGSDFDGATMPDGLEDVTKLPYITYKLLKMGFSEKEVYKILGGNTLRVLETAERVAQTWQE